MPKISGTKNITAPEKTRQLKIEAKLVAVQGKLNAANARIKALVSEKKDISSRVTVLAKENIKLKKQIA